MAKAKAAAVDYGEYAAPKIGDNILATLTTLGDDLIRAEEEVRAAELTLKSKQERVKNLEERLLPEAMDAAQQIELVTASNVKLKLESRVRASISEPKKVAAFAWLRKKGHGPLIKNVIEIPFEAGKDDAAKGLVKLLRYKPILDGIKRTLKKGGVGDVEIAAAVAFLEAAEPSRFELSSTVHSSTLMALVRELLRDGKADQKVLDTLGAMTWKVVTATPKEEKK